MIAANSKLGHHLQSSLALSLSLPDLQVPGQAHSFIEHIQEGIARAEHDPDSLLLFSGGQTRKAAGPRSEAEGYWLVAEAASWWGSDTVRDRAFTEVCTILVNAASNITACT